MNSNILAPKSARPKYFPGDALRIETSFQPKRDSQAGKYPPAEPGAL
jgi:hypothetical protein